MKKIVFICVFLLLLSVTGSAENFGTQLTVEQGLKIIVEDSETRPIVLVKVIYIKEETELNERYDDSMGNKIKTVQIQTIEVLSGDYKEKLIEIKTTANIEQKNKYIVALLPNNLEKRENFIKNNSYDPGTYSIVGGYFQVDDQDRVEAPSYVEGQYLGTLGDIRNILKNEKTLADLSGVKVNSNAVVYDMSGKKRLIKATKGDLLLMVGASETDADTSNVHVICDSDGTVGKVRTSAIAKNKKGRIIKSKVDDNAVLKAAIKDAYVYSTASIKSNKLGTVRKGMVIASEGVKGDFVIIRTATGVGYLRAVNVK